MESRSVLSLALVLFFCSPQQTPVATQPAASVHVPPGVRTADAQPNPLLAVRIEAAERAFTTTMMQYKVGTASFEEVAAWSERLFAAQHDALTGAALNDAAQKRLSILKQLEQTTAARVQSGAATTADSAKATYLRATAEWELSRL